MLGDHDIRVPYLSKAEIEAKAQEFLAGVYDGEFPIDVDEICDRLGVGIIYIPGLKPLLSVDAFITGDFRSIYADEGCADITKNDCRYRFSIAHELGHKVLHSGYYPTSIRDIDTYSVCMREFNNGYAESQANDFAGMILFPSNEVRKLALAMFNRDLENVILQCNQTEREEFLGALCRKFKISSRTALIRLRNTADDEFLKSLL